MAAMQESAPLQQPGAETSGTEKEFNMFAADGIEPERPPAEDHVELDLAPQPAEGEDRLDFINVSSGVEQESEPAVVTGQPGVWGKIVSGYESARAMKASMTQDLAPWTKFADRKKFSVPNKSEVYSRVRTNLKVYHSNYCYMLGGLAIWTAISNLYFVLAMAASVGGYYYYRTVTSDGSTFVFRGREVSPIQFYFSLTGFTLLMFWLTGGGSAMFWLVILSLLVVFGHAGAREIDEEDATEGNSAVDLNMLGSALPTLASLRGV